MIKLEVYHNEIFIDLDTVPEEVKAELYAKCREYGIGANVDDNMLRLWSESPQDLYAFIVWLTIKEPLHVN